MCFAIAARFVVQSKRVLQAGRQWGLAPRLHAEQLSRTGAARLAILMRAASCDHLEQVNKATSRRWENRKPWRPCCRDAIFTCGLKKYAPARALIESGSDCCAGDGLQPGDESDAEHGDDFYRWRARN